MVLRVGFFGGSFDPPHRGHVGVARAARAALGLDRVLLAPVGTQPLKPEGATATFEERVEMTRRAIAGEPGLEVSLADAPRPDRNYTVDTLERLAAELGAETRLYCLMGADSFALLGKWWQAAEILFRAELVVASRPGEQLAIGPSLPVGVFWEPGREQTAMVGGVEICTLGLRRVTGERTWMHVLPGMEIDISATEVRRRIQADEHVAELVVPSVLEYVRERGLYAEP
jgi:nicotinate-nucleotide adenylyltransferase